MSDESLTIDRSGSPLAEVANLGLVRPPVVYLGAIVLGLIVHVLWPRHIVPHSLGAPVGALLTLAAVVLFIYAVRTFRAACTPVPGNRPTTTIVLAGPYRFSRNPIYLAFSVFQLGLALWVNQSQFAAHAHSSHHTDVVCGYPPGRALPRGAVSF